MRRHDECTIHHETKNSPNSHHTHIHTHTSERINGVQYTCKSDVWALALILMECLCGKFPYELDSEEFGGSDVLFYMLERIVDEQVPLHLLQEVGVPEECAQFLRRMLHKDQNARPASEELLCSKPEAQLLASAIFDSPILQRFLVGHGIGVVSTVSDDVDARMQTSRIFALPGAAQRAVRTGLM